MPWQPGQSGNKKGRPPGRTEWRESVEAQRLRDVAYQTLEQVARGIITAPAKDRVAAARELLDRVEGKAVQAIEMSGPDGQPIETRTEKLRRVSPEGLEQLRLIAAEAGGDDAE
jgi:hypothetical protein